MKLKIKKMFLISMYLANSLFASKLHQAAIKGDLDSIVKLSQTENINLVDSFGYTPLLLASLNGHEQIVEFLTQQPNVELTVRDPFGNTALHLAAKKNYPKIIQLLCSKGIDVNDINYPQKDLSKLNFFSFGNSPLHLAAHHGHAAAIDVLCQAGANPHLYNNSRNSIKSKNLPLHLAAMNGHVDAVKSLLAYTDSSLSDQHGKNALHLAAQYGRAEVVKLLLEKGADANALDFRDKSACHVAAKYGKTAGHGESIKLLLEHNADLNSTDKAGRTPLYTAATFGQTQIVDQLTKCGADVHHKRLSGYTPLRAAVLNGHHQVIKSLIAARANPNEQHDVFQDTLLQTAVWKKNFPAIKLLLNSGANVNLPNVYGQTPLHDAASRGYGEIYQYFVENGANPRVYNQDGLTPDDLMKKSLHTVRAANSQ
jgi:ankyrin repeat protein